MTRVDHTYQVPDPLPAAEPGTLIAATDHGRDARLEGARRYTVLYHSTDARGADVAVSGTVLLPSGSPPRQGRPVVSWAHGTTGVADACAPSQSPNLGLDVFAEELRALLRAGYAVTASDYPGLGTPGPHTYLVGADEGNSVADIVTAAHQLLPGLAPVWFAVGHSQGGQAALFATHAARRTGAQRLGAVVAVAPASHLEAMLAGVKASHVPSELSFAFYSLVGLAATEPRGRATDLSSLLGPSAATTASRVIADCVTDSDPALRGVSTEQMLPLPGDRLRRMGERMGAYGDPDRSALTVPTLVVQGDADEDVPPAWTDEVVAHLRRLDSPGLIYRTYAGAGHSQVLGRSVCDVLAFLRSHGGARSVACTPPPSSRS
ncbi:alpha/beta hydrolase family protein [Streptomyces tropicalis]|uniref:Alpha/beta fold hydrolase n=1 Tax=Streptomyces tropicalis TaxID=3034234 RepID=A0ABT6A2A2_9ACTN|nr:alpha/beta fold hydrolase [Streptomyces tropicalis]MDF3298765.1 alpha/beta fold hydrolase [Streptomyces tropicalis]